MGDAARQDLHALVDALPEDELPKVRRVLELAAKPNGKRAQRLAALERIENSWHGQPSTTAEQVDDWIRQSRPQDPDQPV